MKLQANGGLVKNSGRLGHGGGRRLGAPCPNKPALLSIIVPHSTSTVESWAPSIYHMVDPDYELSIGECSMGVSCWGGGVACACTVCMYPCMQGRCHFVSVVYLAVLTLLMWVHLPGSLLASIVSRHAVCMYPSVHPGRYGLESGCHPL